MYAKGVKSLRDLDLALASFRQDARRESRATREEIRRAMTLEDVRLQSERRRRQHVGLEARERAGSPPALSIEGGPGVEASSRVPMMSRSMGCDHDSAEAVPPWYDGPYTPPKLPGNLRDDHSTNVAFEKTDEVSEDVALRVAQAAHTLYPTLVAEVAECALELVQEEEEGSCRTMVVEVDERGAPLRLQSMLRCSSSSNPLDIVPEAMLEDAVGSTAPPGRAHVAATENTAGKRASHFDMSLCDKLYEYGKEKGGNSFRSALLAATKGDAREWRRCDSNASNRGAVRPPHQIVTHLDCNAPRRGTRLQLCREGTAVAESSAGGIVQRIRRAVLARGGARGKGGGGDDADGDGGDDRQCSSKMANDMNHLGCTVSRDPDVLQVVHTRVVKPLTAFFCTSCGGCAARDVLTGLPDSCRSCGEAFEEMPPLLVDSRTNGTTLSKCGDTPLQKTADVGAGAAPPEPVKMTCTIGVSTSTTACDASTSIATHSDRIYSLQLPALSAQGLYFMHLWDQVASRR